MKAICSPENLLNVHEDLRRKTWFPVAWMPMYDPDRSKRPTQGYECDAARQMRLFHDCWRNLLGGWNEKTKNTRLVTFANQNRHQVRSFVGGLLGDQQVWTISIFLHIWHEFTYFAYCICSSIFYMFLHISGTWSPVWRRIHGVSSLSSTIGWFPVGCQAWNEKYWF